MSSVKTLIEKQRACGYRKKGGLYLISGSAFSSCCKLNFPLSVCSCCGEGIRFFRGFKCISTSLFCTQSCSKVHSCLDAIHTTADHAVINIDPIVNPCILSVPDKRIGLMWVGERYYKSPSDFIRESNNVGISKRIATLPIDVEPGKTWVALAHNKGVSKFEERPILGDEMPGVKSELIPVFTPAVFCVFKVEKVQYVVNESESTADLDRLANRGIELVNVIPEGQQTTLNL